MLERVDQHPDPHGVLRHHVQPESSHDANNRRTVDNDPDDAEEPSQLAIPSATLDAAIVLAGRRPMRLPLLGDGCPMTCGGTHDVWWYSWREVIGAPYEEW